VCLIPALSIKLLIEQKMAKRFGKCDCNEWKIDVIKGEYVDICKIKCDECEKWLIIL